MAEVTAYRCDRCKKLFLPEGIRRTIGNIVIPEQGGLTGNNIFVEPCSSEAKREQDFFLASDDKSLRLYCIDYCKACFCKVNDVRTAKE